MKRLILIILLNTIIPFSFAGSKGYTAVMIDIGGVEFFQSNTFHSYADGDLSITSAWEDCWINRSTGTDDRFEEIIRKKLPDGITKKLAIAIWNNDQTAMKRAQQLMKAARKNYKFDINGMYVLKSEAGKISIMALGTQQAIGRKNPSRKITIPWTDEDPERSAAEFDLGLCKVSEPFDYEFGP